MRSRPVLALLFVVAAVTLSSCGIGHPVSVTTGSPAPSASGTASPAPSGSPVQVPGTVGYLFSGPGAIVYLQWQLDGSGRFSGTSLNAAVNGAPPNETVEVGTTPIEGQINGTAVTIDIAGHTDQGVLSGSTLALNVVQTDGSIRAITYRPATPADYNSALAQLQQAAQGDDAKEQQQQSQAKLQSNAQDALNALNADNSRFSNAQAVRGELAKADSDLQKERQDASKGNGDNCYNITGVVDYDATSVVGYDVTSSGSYAVDQEQSSITGIRSDIKAVQNAEAALSAYGLPGTSGAGDAVATAQQQIAEAVDTTNKAIDGLNADLASAYNVANAAGTGPCAGQGPGGPPAGLSAIS